MYGAERLQYMAVIFRNQNCFSFFKKSTDIPTFVVKITRNLCGKTEKCRNFDVFDEENQKLKLVVPFGF